jgi:hypothetical protein
MNEHTGQVISLDNKFVITHIKREENCARCGVCKVAVQEVSARNDCGAAVGDWVRIRFPYPFWYALAMLYGIPFAGLMLGLFAGYALSGNALAGFFGGVFCMGLCFFIVKRLKKNREPVAVEVMVSAQFCPEPPAPARWP